MQGARRGTRSQFSRITPWAKGRRSTAEPPGLPVYLAFYIQCLAISALNFGLYASC